MIFLASQGESAIRVPAIEVQLYNFYLEIITCDPLPSKFIVSNQKEESISAQSSTLNELTNISKDDSIFCGGNFNVGLDVTEIMSRHGQRLGFLHQLQIT